MIEDGLLSLALVEKAWGFRFRVVGFRIFGFGGFKA